MFFTAYPKYFFDRGRTNQLDFISPENARVVTAIATRLD
jgi:hypothetical protein